MIHQARHHRVVVGLHRILHPGKNPPPLGVKKVICRRRIPIRSSVARAAEVDRALPEIIVLFIACPVIGSAQPGIRLPPFVARRW